jgi:hypothetical protein
MKFKFLLCCSILFIQYCLSIDTETSTSASTASTTTSTFRTCPVTNSIIQNRSSPPTKQKKSPNVLFWEKEGVNQVMWSVKQNEQIYISRKYLYKI